MLCCVDPGKRVSGVSLWFVDAHGATLGSADVVKCASGSPAVMARQIVAWATTDAVGWRPSAQLVFALEVPQHYATQTATGRGVDALEVVIEELGRLLGDRVVARWLPFEWKRNTPKKIHHARMRGALTSGEWANIKAPGDHNCRDAVALGLFAVGRLGRGGVK